MRRAVIFTFLLFVNIFLGTVTAVAPKVVQATYEIKDAVVSDTAYEVAVFNVDFDQELYLMENFPCPCESCSSVNYPPANETGYNITSIAINDWNEGELYGPGAIKYYKIELDNSFSCSNIYVEVEILHGFIAVYGGNSRVPTASDYDWYRPVSGRRYLPICNAHRKFGLGTLYVAVRTNQPLNEYNRYKIRVISQSTGTCPAPRTMPTITSDFPVGFQWLQDSIPTNRHAEPGVYDYYGYLVETECIRFAASVHKNSSVGDVDLFVSTIAPPTGYEQVLDPREDWVSALDGEDAVSFYHCSKTAPFTIWLAVTAYDLSTGYDIVATTQDSTFMYNPLSTIGLNSPGNELTRHFRMECTNPDNIAETERFYCEFPGFTNCVSEDINCCFPMYPIAPTKTSNPLWPWNAAISQLAPLATVTWEDQDYNAERASNRVSIALMHTIHHDEQHFHYTRTEDFGNCKLSWLGRITNKDGEAFLDDTTFEPKKRECTEGIATLVKDTTDLIDQLSLSTDYLQLTKVHYNLIFKYLSDDWFGCRDMVMGLASTTQIPGSTDFVRVCQHYPGTTAFDEDPCCNIALLSEQCCPEVPSQEFIDVLDMPNEAEINAQCSSPQCTMKQLKYLSAAQKRAFDRDNGCTAVLTRDADPHSINFLSTFIHECQKQIYGEQLEGIRCTKDSDCASNSCNKTIGLCAQGVEETLSCLAASIDPSVARFLFNSWQILDDATLSRMEDEFRSRFVKSNQCVGSTSINYRDHYLWGREEVTCSDDCLANDLETRCLDTSCNIDPTCNYYELGLCHRNYYFTRGDPSGCLEDKRCNWLSCDGLTDEECETACNNFATDHFCADCRAGNYPYCEEITSRTTENECNTGICDIEGVDPSQCESTQSCTAKCNGVTCPNQTACENSGLCSDRDVFAKYIEATGSTDGVCLSLLELNNDGFAMCNADTHVSTAVGCADFTRLTENTCTASGQRWWTFAMTQAECESFDVCHETYGDKQFVTWKTPQQCTDLCDAVSGTAFTWTKGVWFTGTLLPLVWTPRQYVPINSIGQTFDFLEFRKEVRNAIALKLNYAFTTESLCRYDSLVKMVGFTACDCGGGFDMNCADNLISDSLIGATLACPYIESSVTAPPAFITIFDNTVSRSSFCTVVHIHRTPALSFELENTLALSSEIYTRKLFNTFSVVKNDKGATVGQIVSDAIELQLEFDDPSTTISNPFELCIAVDTAIGVYSAYTEYGFGVLNVDTNVITASEIPTTQHGNQICAKVVPGHYVIVAHLPDGEWQAVEPFDEAQAQMKWVGVAFYFAGVAFGVFQIIIIAINHESLRHTFNKKLLFAIITVVFLLLRGIYFTFPPQLLSEQFVIQYLLFELPTFMFFSLYTIVLFLWNQVLIKQSVMARGRSRIMVKKAFIGYLIANCVMYAIFVAFVLIYRFWVGKAVACANEINTSTSQDRFYITLGYRIFIAVVCFGVSVAFMIQGIKFIIVFRKYKMVNSSGKKARIRVLITFIAVLCTGLFIGRTIVFLYAAVTGNQVVVVIFVLFEALPSYALLYYLRPFNSKEIFGVSTDSTGTNGSSRRSASANSQREPGSSAHPATSSVTNTNEGDDDDDDEDNYPESEEESSSEKGIAVAEIKPEGPVAESSSSSDSDHEYSTESGVKPNPEP